MRPLPRVHAITDGWVLAAADLGIRAAAIAAAGPAVAIHVRDHRSSGRVLHDVTRRVLALAGPPEAAVIVNGHPEIARGLGAQGVQLRRSDLSPEDARRVFPHGWIGCSVHSEAEADAAAAEGADYLLAGPVFPTASHPDEPAAGLDLVRRLARKGIPVVAIGGITGDNVAAVRDAGAWGVAAIRSLWEAPDSAAAALALLNAWRDAA